MLIVLAGLPGAGKTTIARELARRLQVRGAECGGAGCGAVHVRIDSIEEAIRRSPAHAGCSIEDAGYLVGYAVAEDNLRLGRVVIADSVNPWPETRDAWVDVARRTSVRVLEVEVVCSNAGEHRRRVEDRAPDIEGFRLPTWGEVIGRDYRTWTRDRVVVDTSGATVEASVDRIVAALGSPDRGAL